MGIKGNLGLWVFLFFCFLLLSSFTSPSLSRPIQGNAPPQVNNQFQVFKMKNTKPYSPSEELKKKRKKMKNMGSRPFEQMLPKGFVPPSGSSSCHNDFPNSIDFYCYESKTNPWELWSTIFFFFFWGEGLEKMLLVMGFFLLPAFFFSFFLNWFGDG